MPLHLLWSSEPTGQVLFVDPPGALLAEVAIGSANRFQLALIHSRLHFPKGLEPLLYSQIKLWRKKVQLGKRSVKERYMTAVLKEGI